MSEKTDGGLCLNIGYNEGLTEAQVIELLMQHVARLQREKRFLAMEVARLHGYSRGEASAVIKMSGDAGILICNGHAVQLDHELDMFEP